MFEQVYPNKNKYPELQSRKGLVRDNLDDYFDWINPFELFYYYVSGYAMRYVNNYYDYGVYSPQLFQKNVFKAIDNFCKTEANRATDMCRAACVEIPKQTQNIWRIYDDEDCQYKIKYIWKSQPNCCDKCANNDGKEFKSQNQIFTHWNCRCNIEEHIQLVNSNNIIILDDVNIL